MRLVRAAGGVVLRRGPAGELETLLVHRPRYDDWTLPKGKLLPGETEDDTALREVEEETGLACEIEGELTSVEYTDSRGRPKRVRYYVMRPCSGSFHPHAEVDEVRWLPLPDAAQLLSYDRDRDVLAALPAEAA